jgi:hypothetical protein
MCVGNDTCAYVDASGSFLAIPFNSIDRVIVAESKFSECVDHPVSQRL